MKHFVKRNQFVNIRQQALLSLHFPSCKVLNWDWLLCPQVLLDATKPQDGVNGTAEGLHNAEGADSGRATGSEVECSGLGGGGCGGPLLSLRITSDHNLVFLHKIFNISYRWLRLMHTPMLSNYLKLANRMEIWSPLGLPQLSIMSMYVAASSTPNRSAVC